MPASAVDCGSWHGSKTELKLSDPQAPCGEHPPTPKNTRHITDKSTEKPARPQLVWFAQFRTTKRET
eukprot:845336-Pyramimonas_sp.AAC.1